jgi:hypothetical protein
VQRDWTFPWPLSEEFALSCYKIRPGPLLFSAQFYNMRTLLLISLLIGIGVDAFAQSPDQGKSASDRLTKQTEQFKAQSFDTSGVERAIRESVKEVSEKTDSNAREKLESDQKLANYTEYLATFTLCLVAATVVLAIVAGWQGFQLKRSVDSTEVSNAPYVMPELKLLNDGTKSDFIPRVEIKLWNHGKTPAIMRSAVFELHLGHNEKDIQKKFTDKRTKFQAHGVIGAERASSMHEWLCKFPRALTEGEILKVRKPLEIGDSIRLFLVGQVEYDDFFGYTHKLGYCFKIFRGGKYSNKNYKGISFKQRFRSKKSDEDDEPIAE